LQENEGEGQTESLSKMTESTALPSNSVSMDIYLGKNETSATNLSHQQENSKQKEKSHSKNHGLFEAMDFPFTDESSMMEKRTTQESTNQSGNQTNSQHHLADSYIDDGLQKMPCFDMHDLDHQKMMDFNLPLFFDTKQEEMV
jgi:hypothetical protein